MLLQNTRTHELVMKGPNMTQSPCPANICASKLQGPKKTSVIWRNPCEYSQWNHTNISKRGKMMFFVRNFGNTAVGPEHFPIVCGHGVCGTLENILIILEGGPIVQIAAQCFVWVLAHFCVIVVGQSHNTPSKYLPLSWKGAHIWRCAFAFG